MALTGMIFFVGFFVLLVKGASVIICGMFFLRAKGNASTTGFLKRFVYPSFRVVECGFV